MKLFERCAWDGMVMLLTLYLTKSTDTGTLGFIQEQKGYFMGTVVTILYFLPLITGAIADRYGYKNVLIIAYLILASGYFLMSIFKTYFSIYIVFMYVSVSVALFKPIISTTIAETTDDETSSIGFGIFYMMVNIGAFVGPVIASKVRDFDWQYTFITLSIVILIHLIIVLFFFKEPRREKSEIPLGQSIIQIFKNIWLAVSDLKLLVFLLIIIGFWSMCNLLSIPYRFLSINGWILRFYTMLFQGYHPDLHLSLLLLIVPSHPN